jgi:hypothetical protein
MTNKVQKRARQLIGLAYDTLRTAGKQKAFCIGCNKTGTTSMAAAFRELGMVVGRQRMAEKLFFDWGKRDFHRILLYCQTAQAFQDIPFSLPFTYQAVDRKFTGSKFILTLRDNPEQWYSSLTRFHTILFGHDHLPSADELKEVTYIQKGDVYAAHQLIYNTPPDDPYNKESMIAHYNTHNSTVIEYFRHRPEDLLVLNVAEPGAYERLCKFLGKPFPGKEFPWENKTAT